MREQLLVIRILEAFTATRPDARFPSGGVPFLIARGDFVTRSKNAASEDTTILFYKELPAPP
jgi:hypothetical protein